MHRSNFLWLMRDQHSVVSNRTVHEVAMRIFIQFLNIRKINTYDRNMKKNTLSLLMFIDTLALLCCFTLSAADTESTSFPGVRHVHRHTTEPREIDMHIVIIDMKRPGVKIKTTGPNDDPDTQTDFETTRQFVKRTGAHIGINGGFFGYTRKAVETGKGDLCSLAVSDGKLVCGWGHNQHDAVNIGDDNAVTFVRRAKEDKTGSATNPEIKLYNAIAGNVRLVENGKILVKGGDPTYPQTAVGHTAEHHLILFVSDGRQPGFSEGMTYEDVAGVLKEFGAVDAIAFDGGGSATMVMADGKDGEPKVLNRPSDGKERAVGNNLGVIISDKK